MSSADAKEKATESSQDRLTRLHVNLNRPTANALKEVAERRDLTLTEAIRQAIGTWSWIDAALRRGARIQLVEADGEVKEVIPMN